MASTYLDGDWTLPSPAGPVTTGVDMETHARWWRQPLEQLTANWEPLPQICETLFDSAAGGMLAFLVEESDPQPRGAGILKWTRFWSQQPASHTTATSTAFAFQAVIDGKLVEIPIGTTATVVNDYFYTSNPGSIGIFRAFKWVQVGTSIYYIGTPGESTATVVAAADSTIQRWKGPFWKRSTPFVNKTAILASIGP